MSASLINSNDSTDHMPPPARPAPRLPFQLAIFISMLGVISLGSDQASGGSSLVRQVLWLILGLAGSTSLVSRGERQRFNGIFDFNVGLLLALIVYCGLSMLWSALPVVTLKRSLLFALVALLAFTAFGRRDVEGGDFLCMTARPLLWLVMLSFIYAAILPGSAITPLGWRGVASFKNEFGQICCLAVLCMVYLFGEIRLRLWLPLLVMAAAGAVLAKSVTSLVALMAALAACAALGLLRRMHRLPAWRAMMIVLAMAVLLAAFIALSTGLLPTPQALVDGLFAAMGKSSTLTGRTELWQLVLKNTRYHNPWLGGGYGAFWNGLDSPAGYIAWEFGGGYVGEAHNSYIDILNDLGYLGLGGLVLLLLIHTRNVLRLTACASRESTLHFGLLVFILFVSYAESVLLRSTVLLNLLLIASYIRVNSLLYRAKEGL